MNEYRVFGPPGTGKTTYLSNLISEARKKYGNDKIFVTSFTRAAAVEIASRDGTEIPKSMVGTLHAHCYRSLGAPALAEAYIEEFVKEYPQFSFKTSVDVDNPYDIERSAGGSQSIFEIMNLYRSTLIPVDRWPTNVHNFYKLWNSWKETNGFLDFTDLLEISLKEVKYAPGRPKVGFVDEAQDMTPLQFALVRKWAEDMEKLIIAGDDQQCLYDFLGASPDSMLDPPLPEDRIIILNQSYRLPRRILDWSEKIISKVQRRQEKEYKPRTENGKEVEGRVRVSRATSQDVRRLLVEVEKDLAKDKTVMVLASCSYMLIPFIQLLMKEGVAFHNPYRKKTSAWNPLSWNDNEIQAGQALLSFLQFSKSLSGDAPSTLWSFLELEDWLPFVSSKILKHGIKTKVEKESIVEMYTVYDIFKEEVADIMVNGTEAERWQIFKNNLTKEGIKKLQYPMRILKHNTEQLFKKPQLIVGTIHSVKGGEADIVYVIPDLSKPQKKAWHGSRTEADALRRLFYVAGTRAREELVLCSPSHTTEGFPLMEGLRRE